MPATVSRIILDAEHNPTRVIHPVRDDELDDPAYAPSGTTQYDIPRADYLKLDCSRDVLAAVHPYVVMSGNATIASVVQARLDLIDADEAMKLAAATFQSITVETGDNPTGAQKIAIAKLKAKSDAATSDRQAILDKIQALLAS